MICRHQHQLLPLTLAPGGAKEDKYAVVDVTMVSTGRPASILEEVEVSRAMFEVYEGGVVRINLWESKLFDTDTLCSSFTKGGHSSCVWVTSPNTR